MSADHHDHGSDHDDDGSYLYDDGSDHYKRDSDELDLGFSNDGRRDLHDEAGHDDDGQVRRAGKHGPDQTSDHDHAAGRGRPELAIHGKQYDLLGDLRSVLPDRWCPALDAQEELLVPLVTPEARRSICLEQPYDLADSSVAHIRCRARHGRGSLTSGPSAYNGAGHAIASRCDLATA